MSAELSQEERRVLDTAIIHWRTGAEEVSQSIPAFSPAEDTMRWTAVLMALIFGVAASSAVFLWAPWSSKIISPLKGLRLQKQEVLSANLEENLRVQLADEAHIGALATKEGIWVLPLYSGTLHGAYHRNKDQLELRVETPLGQINIVGTEFHIHVGETLSVAVSQGEVEVHSESGQRSVPAGEYFGEYWSQVPLVDFQTKSSARVEEPVSPKELSDVEELAPLELPPLPLESATAEDVNVPKASVSSPAPKVVSAPDAEGTESAPEALLTKDDPAPALLKESSESLYASAEKALRDGDRKKAKTILAEVATRHPAGIHGALAIYELGNLYREEGDFIRARSAFDTARVSDLPEVMREGATLQLCTIEIELGAANQAEQCLTGLDKTAGTRMKVRIAELRRKLVELKKNIEEK